MSEGVVKQAALAVGDEIWNAAGWVGGAFAGEFDRKRSTGQIVVDAVISMFPVAGEVTAARDSIAISLRMSEDSEARENTSEWVALILCLLAVVPVFGGLLKGVGKLLLRAVSVSEDLTKLSAEIVAVVRKFGVGNAERWFKELDYAKYQGAVLDGFNQLIERLVATTQFVLTKFGAALPVRVEAFLKSLPPKMNELKALASRHIPERFKELNALLNRTRQHLVEGTWADVSVGAGRVRMMTQEARLAEVAVEAGKSQGHLRATVSHFQGKNGWPDLLESNLRDFISSFSVKGTIEGITHKPGKVMVRILDDAQLVNPWHLPGRFWMTYVPESGTAWRIKCAVKHKWNKNGSYVSMEVPTTSELQALGIHHPADWEGMRLWKGPIAEQIDNAGTPREATNRLLSGGAIQYFVDFNHDHNRPVLEWIKKKVIVMRTNWDDVSIPGELQAQAMLLSQREHSAKIRHEGYVLRGAVVVGKVQDNQVTTSQKDVRDAEPPNYDE